MMRFQILQGQTQTFHLQFQMTKVMTSCQGHSFVRNKTSPLFGTYLDENEMPQVPVCYYVKNGILMRKWRFPDFSADVEWTVNHQIVVWNFSSRPMKLPCQAI